MDVQEPEGILFKKLYPGEEHHGAPRGLVEIGELSTQRRELWEVRQRLM